MSRVDDVYLKKFNEPDNLIEDGDIEGCSTINVAPTDDCPWYIDGLNSYLACTAIAPFNDDLIPEKNPVSKSPEFYSLVTPINYYVNGHAGISARENKSGAQSLFLYLNYIDPSCSSVQAYTAQASPMCKVSINFDFRGLLDCSQYALSFPSNPGNATFGPSSTISNSYHCSAPVVLNNGDHLILDKCCVAFDQGIGIEVKSGATLEVNNTSNLFACKEMWKGITVDAGGIVKVLNGSTISDAEKAIGADGSNGSQTIILYENSSSRVFFDRNIYDLYLTNGNFSTSSIYKADFLCTGGIITKHNYPGSAISDHYGSRPVAHIYLNKVNPISVGQTGGQGFNDFSDSDFGILADEGVTLTAYHNNFTNIGKTGISIYSSTQSPSSLFAGHTLSGNQTYRNTFTNCGNGIVCSGEVNSYIYDNYFTDGQNSAIEIDNNYHSLITVQNNKVTNFRDGISFYDLATQQLIDVSDNILSGGHDALGICSNNHGIVFWNFIPYKIPLQVSNNHIDDYPYSIRMLNIWAAGSISLTGNIINYNFDLTHIGGLLYRGIDLSNCVYVKVANNTVNWNTRFNSPADINLHASEVQGMHMEHLQSSDIKDNWVTTCGTGMYMYDDCSGSYFTCNHFIDDYPGIDFSISILPPAEGSPGNPTYNFWNGSYDNHASYFKVTGFPSPFNYYYTAGSTSEFPDPPLAMLGRLNPFGVTPISIYPCADGGSHNNHMMADDPTKKDLELTRILDQPDSTPVDNFPVETEYKKQEYAYQTLKAFPLLTNTSDRIDFMDSTEQNNIGKLNEVQDMILAGDSLQAINKNILINDSNIIETNKKFTNDLNLRIDTLSSVDSLTGIQIAQQVALQGGEAIYWLRGKFKLEIEDNYVSNQRRANHTKTQQLNPESLISVYPNPASNELIIDGLNGICDIELYDSYGNLERKFNSTEKNSRINLTDFASGIYYLKISNSFGYFKTIFTILK